MGKAYGRPLGSRYAWGAEGSFTGLTANVPEAEEIKQNLEIYIQGVRDEMRAKGILYAISYDLFNSDLIKDGNYIHLTWFEVHNEIEVKEDMGIRIAAGYPDRSHFFDNTIYVINPSKRSIRERSIPINGEPEGFCFYKGKEYLYMDSHLRKVFMLSE